MSEAPVSLRLRVDVTPALTKLHAVSLGHLSRRPERRLWADRHLEALGWALVGLVGLLPIIWAVFR